MINSLYIHIPFCLKKCLYCDFNSYENIKLQDSYIDAVLKELKQIEQNRFETIFIGGGTPTILSIKNLERLLKAINTFSYNEFTIEGNPGTINEENAKLLNSYGINRVSLGLQAWQDNLLIKLGRIHSLEDFLNSYNILRKNNIKNINVDLMFGIPGQDMKNWIHTLNEVIKLNLEHISCYGLIIEEGTPFFNMFNSGKLDIVDEVTEREMYHFAIKRLESAGFKHYEISNFSLKGKECRHNITYWKNEEYIGIGAGAHSYVDKKRYNNFKKIDEYIAGVNNKNSIEEEVIVSINDEISEFMFLGLRMIKGISKKEFEKRFEIEIEEIFSKEIKDCIEKGLLIQDNDRIMLSKKGLDFANQVFVNFIR